MTTKKCKICGEHKRVDDNMRKSDFHHHGDTNDGFSPYCKPCLRDKYYYSSKKSPVLTQSGIYDIEVKVCKAFGLPHEELHLPHRTNRIVNPRQMVWLILKEKLGMGFREIGLNYSVRKGSKRVDHSTIICGIKRTKDLIATEEMTRDIYHRVVSEYDRIILPFND